MDRLAALEATWHADHSLAQTVFTCLYLLHPQRCADPALCHTLPCPARACRVLMGSGAPAQAADGRRCC